MRVNLFVVGFVLLAFTSCQEEQKGTSESQSEQSSEGIATNDALTSWNSTPSLDRITSFVESVTDSTSESFVIEEDRIAVFDNDGTLWAEQPMYFQLYFAIDQVKAMAADHPEWNEQEPMKSVLAGDLESLKSQGLEGILKLVMTTHAGMSEKEFNQTVKQWADTATHPVTNLRYIDMVYQPMLELLDYFRANGIKTYIVSGGGVSFMRAWAPEVYGIPKEQIIGTTLKTEFVSDEEGQRVMRQPTIDFIDDKEGKPENINRIIGQKPIIAFGNSDGDLAMLQYTASRQGLSLPAYIHHTDSLREYAYDREGHVGVLIQGMEEAKSKGWLVVDMEKDWNVIYPRK